MDGEEVLVISNGDDVYVYRPESQQDITSENIIPENTFVQQLKSYLRPVSSAMNFFNVRIDGYISNQNDSLWLNPEGAANYIERGKVAKLAKEIPCKLQTENKKLDMKAEFKYRLSRPGTADSIICSREESKEKASLVEKDVGLEMGRDMIEEQVEAKESPLKQV